MMTARMKLHYLKERYSDQILTILTILLALLMFVLAPLFAIGSVIAQELAVLVTLVLIVGAATISGSVPAVLLLLVAVGLNLVVVISRLTDTRSTVDLYLAAAAWLIFAVTLGWIVARAVFGRGRVSYHRIIGAVFLYLLIALAFSSLFIFVGLSIPDAFSGIKFEDTPALTSTLFYFSFVTLTSTGYGDLYPVHPIARSLCNLETILGQLYPATLLARLVSLETGSQSS
jgi:uncharacterized membrane protein